MSTIAANEKNSSPSNEGDKILRTAADIGRAIGLKPRQAYHLVASGSLRSVKKIGGRYFASRTRLLEEITGIND